MNLAEEENNHIAEQQAINDYADSHCGPVVTNKMSNVMIEDALNPQLPVCMDFDRFAKHMRNV